MLNKAISRRQFFKILLAAGGGLTAAAFVPNQWVKPLVQTGVLPVHARASVVYHLEVDTHDGHLRVYALSSGTMKITNLGTNRHLASPAETGIGCYTGVTLQNILITMTTTGHPTETALTTSYWEYPPGAGIDCGKYYYADFVYPANCEITPVFSAPNGSSVPYIGLSRSCK